MISEGNRKAIEDAGLSFILGARMPDVPYVIATWRKDHPDTEPADGQVFIQPWPAGPTGNRRDQVIYYQYKADRARRTLRGIDEQVAKAERPSPKGPRSNRTGSSGSPAPPRPSTANWRPKPAPWPASRAASPTSPTQRRSSCSTPTTGSTTSRSRSGCPNTTRPPGRPADLPPQARVDRRAPDRRLRRPRGHPPDRRLRRLVHPTVRPDRPPLPHHPYPRRPANPHRRRPAPKTTYAPRSRSSSDRPCALIWRKSGLAAGAVEGPSLWVDPHGDSPASPDGRRWPLKVAVEVRDTTDRTCAHR
jgi:hypothetical protein